MRIGFIGAGRVGYTMGKFLKQHDYEVSGYYSRTNEHAKDAAAFTDTQYFEDVRELKKHSDAIILTVSDSAIKKVFDEIKNYPEIAEKTICHTSGSVSSLVFDEAPVQVYGYSIHPIYAISDKYASYKNFSNAFITIEGHEKHLSELVSIFSHAGIKTGTLKTEDKSKYHASCVMASNLVCGIYGAAIKMMESCGFDFDTSNEMLIGLFRDNAMGIADKGLINQLTGPIDRNDVVTVMSHLKTIPEEMKPLYVEASKYALEIAKEKNKENDYSEMALLLESALKREEGGGWTYEKHKRYI